MSERRRVLAGLALVFLAPGFAGVIEQQTVGDTADQQPRMTQTTEPRIAPARATRSRRTAPAPDWAALAACESSNNPRATSPSGKYRGLYQFDRATWRSVGGTGDPAAASPAEQTRRAQQLYAERGAQPWPECGRYLR